MGRFFRALAWAAGFAIPAAAAGWFGYAATGDFFRTKAVPYPFEHFGLAVGAASVFSALALVSFLRYLFRLAVESRRQPR